MRLDVVRSALEQSGGVSDSFSDAVTLGSGREVHLLDPRTKPDASSVRLGVSFALGTLVCLGIIWAGCTICALDEASTSNEPRRRGELALWFDSKDDSDEEGNDSPVGCACCAC